MVKSRRRASAKKSRPNATFAWRPSVSTSSRRVVVSIVRPSMISVTVPCEMPVARDLEAGRARAADHFVRSRRRRQIEIARLQAEDEVAHRAADEPRLLVPRRSAPEARARAGRAQQPAILEAVRPAARAGALIRYAPAPARRFPRCAGTYVPWPRGAKEIQRDQSEHRGREADERSECDTRPVVQCSTSRG